MTLLAWLVVIAMPVVASAHGGEHAGMRAAGAATALNVDGYRVEMSSHPSPLARGAPGHLVATVRHADSGQPLSGGRVLIGLSPLGVTPDLQVASEDPRAGSYAVAITPARLGAHQARVILDGFEGRASQAPLVLDFPLGVERPPGLGGPVWVLFGAVVAIGLGTAYAVVHRARLGWTEEPRLDLLTVPWIRQILTAPAFQPALQIPSLVVMVAIVWLGLVDVQDGGMNLATKFTWTIVVAFFGLSLVAGHRLTLRTYPDARSASRAFLPMAAIVLGFTLVGLVVLSLPMGMRHGS